MLSIEITNGQKIYRPGKLIVPALMDVTITIKKGEMVAIMGPSGSGKTTLMNVIGLLDRLTNGELKIDDEPIELMFRDSKLAKLRSQKIGFVFQSFNLLPRVSALGNVMMPTSYVKKGRKDRLKRAMHVLTQLGLKDRVHHKSEQLSGGEKQRVAIARALINNPDIILADEPTGNLDSKSGQEVLNILKDLNKEGKTVIIITHDARIADQCERIIRLFDGRIEGEKHV